MTWTSPPERVDQFVVASDPHASSAPLLWFLPLTFSKHDHSAAFESRWKCRTSLFVPNCDARLLKHTTECFLSAVVNRTVPPLLQIHRHDRGGNNSERRAGWKLFFLTCYCMQSLKSNFCDAFACVSRWPGDLADADLPPHAASPPGGLLPSDVPAAVWNQHRHVSVTPRPALRSQVLSKVRDVQHQRPEPARRAAFAGTNIAAASVS